MTTIVQSYNEMERRIVALEAREVRLRERIDTLLDQREDLELHIVAQHLLIMRTEEREKNYQRLLEKARVRLDTARRSRDLWKRRAQNAENAHEMWLAENRRKRHAKEQAAREDGPSAAPLPSAEKENA